ncbi:MAG: helix-turn-helix domain-containing protein [Cryomorphaceae bacterium]
MPNHSPDLQFMPNRSPDVQFLTYTPLHPALAGLVAYYYIHFSDNEHHDSRFEYYPHYRNAVTAYLDAGLRFDDFGSEAAPLKGKSFKALYTRNYSHSITVHLQGRFRKMGIAFEPLGVNHFLDESLCNFAPRTVNPFSGFGSDFESVVRAVLNDPKADPVSVMDDFMLSRYTGFQCHTLKRAVRVLIENEGESSVEALASELEISRKTLLRHFRKHLCCTVEDYRKLIRFRNALNDYREQTEQMTFTELAHKHSYYDQPAFIRHFKSVTGKTPRRFFAGLKHFGASDTYWSPKG